MDLFAEIILDNYKNPHHFGLIGDAEINASDLNPLCGDKQTVTLKLEDDKIKDFGFEGSGCAISMAATSLLSDEIIGKSLVEVENIPDQKIYELLGIEISPARVKCALLGLSCIKKAIKWYIAEKKL